jgi:hypothetical protein
MPSYVALTGYHIHIGFIRINSRRNKGNQLPLACMMHFTILSYLAARETDTNTCPVGPIRNGDVVLFNEKVLTAHVNFSLRTSFVFLPEDGFCFINKNTREEYPVDFYDPQQWVKYAFSPCSMHSQACHYPLSRIFGLAASAYSRADASTVYNSH